MKRFTSTVALLAFVTALSASVALAQQGTATKPAEPAKTTEPAKTEATTPAKTMSHHHHMAKAPAMTKVDVNTCTKDDLTKLGLSDADADKVIAGRPYKSKAQLKTKGGLDAKEYGKVSAHVWAKQTKAEKTETAK